MAQQLWVLLLVGVLSLARVAVAFVPSASVRCPRAVANQPQIASSCSAPARTPSLSVRPSGVTMFGKSTLEEGLLDADGEEVQRTGAKREKKEATEGKRGDTSKISLAPEETFWEGKPDVSETFIPAVSIITILGIVPFAAAIARQVWVTYTITSRRISIVSGFGGNEFSEIVYPEIKRMVYVYRFFGRCGDVVLELKDGSKLELKSLPEFERNYNYILSQTSEECQAVSQQIRSDT